ncbi:MAG TPA: Ig-like domain-containing protein [Pirellulales bacterium]|nr:Ig-like domain-containing protein [Pirellulales bacterium]
MRRRLGLEPLEDRRLLSVDPSTSPEVAAALSQATNMSNYTASQIDSADQWVVGYAAGQSPTALATAVGATTTGPTGLIDNTAVFTFPSSVSGATAESELAALPGETFAYPIVTQQATLDSFTPPTNDPLFDEEWNLNNVGQTGGTPGADINVLPAWQEGYTGQGVTVGVVDSGVYYNHPDLSANYNPSLSYDFFENITNAEPPLGPLLEPFAPGAQAGEDSHGTEVAGLVAGNGANGTGTVGVAPGATLASERLVTFDPQGDLVQGGDMQSAAALSFHPQQIDIYNNSWGYIQGGPTSGSLGPADPLTIAAMQQGVTTGRNGLGSIYVFAAGNGGNQVGFQNTNDEEETASRYAITVAALGDQGQESLYSASGASVLVSAPGGLDAAGAADENGIPSASVLAVPNPAQPGTLQYEATYDDDGTFGMNGTSAATPQVSGTVALMLQANPKLSWRDVQQILAETATENDPTDPGWFNDGYGYTSDGAIVPVNSAGAYNGATPLPAGVTVTPFHINDKFGFGEVNAAAAVNMAKNWTPLQPEASISSGPVTVNQAIPDGVAQGVSTSVTFTGGIHVEHAQLTFTVTHPQRGDIEVILTSPNGTRSVLQAVRSFETPNGDTTYDATIGTNGTLTPNANYTNWSTSSVQEWGESSAGTWTVTVADDDANGQVGTFNSFNLTLYGPQDYAPVAQDFTVNDNENQASSFNVLSHTYDTDGNYSIAPGSLTITSQPADGTLSVNPQTGQVVYTPNFNFHGIDTFTYTVHDNNTNAGTGVTSRTATVTIDVGAVNQAPVAKNIVTATNLGTPVTIDIPANVTDTSGTVLPSSVTIVSQPTFGTVSVNASTGIATYTPGPNFSSSDSFEYTVGDNNGLTSNVATVTINLSQLAPVASSFTQPNANENVTQQVNVLGHVTGSVNPATVAVVTAPLHGTVAVDPVTGLINYTPQANFFGNDSFTYTVANFQGTVSNIALVSLTVLSQGIPVALNHEFVLVPGSSVIQGVSALDDPSNTGALITTLVTQAQFGTVSLNTNGTFTYTPGANFPGIDQFNYRVSNGVANSNVATITLVSPNYHYIEQLYADVLNRTASEAEILGWVARINMGVSLSQIAAGFLGSGEYLSDFINSSYEQLLSRGADFTGLAYWLQQLQAGLSMEQFLAALAGSPEYFALHGGTNQDLVASFYQTFLSRGASQPEISYWANQITSGVPASTVAMQFLTSEEYRADVTKTYYFNYLDTTITTQEADQFVANFGPTISRAQIQNAILSSNSFYDSDT